MSKDLNLQVKYNEKLKANKLEILDSFWENEFIKVQFFITENNRYPSLYAKLKEERELAFWVKKQRDDFENNKLSESKITALNDNNFIWKLEDEPWEDYFLQFKAFIEKNEYYPRRYCGKEEDMLALWVSVQRQEYENGVLNQEKINKLNSLVFAWDLEQLKWINNFMRLKKFIKENEGRYPSGNATDKDEKKLCTWLNTERKKFNYGEVTDFELNCLDEISKIQFNVLKNEIGNKMYFRNKENKSAVNNTNKTVSWITIFKKFKKFVAQNNTYPLSSSYDKEEIALSNWVRLQRKKFKFGRMSDKELNSLSKQDRKEYNALIEYGFIFNSYSDNWEIDFEKVQDFITENNSYPKSNSKDETEERLGCWVNAQRRKFKNGAITMIELNELSAIDQERYNRLIKDGFIFKVYDLWEEALKNLENFVKEYGKYPDIDTNDKEEKRLAIWVRTQRMCTNNGQINLARYKILKRRNFIFDSNDEELLIKANKEFFRKIDEVYSR